MNRTSNDRKQLESILRESLLEISQSGSHSRNQVVSEVVTEVVTSIEEQSVDQAPARNSGNLLPHIKTD